MRDSFVFFIKKAPEVWIDEDGLVHITDHTGGATVERIMRLKTLHELQLTICEKLAKWQVDRVDRGPTVVAMRRKKKAPAH